MGLQVLTAAPFLVYCYYALRFHPIPFILESPKGAIDTTHPMGDS